jgi:hypothetical protein
MPEGHVTPKEVPLGVAKRIPLCVRTYNLYLIQGNPPSASRDLRSLRVTFHNVISSQKAPLGRSVLLVAWLPELVLSLVICPFPAILLTSSIIVFTYGVFGYVV